MAIRKSDVMINDENLDIIINDNVILKSIEEYIDASIMESWTQGIKKIEISFTKSIISTGYVYMPLKKFLDELILRYKGAGWHTEMDWVKLILTLS